MKVFEYRLVLPMTPEQYKRCQLYMVAKASLEDATKAEAEGAANDCMEILKNEEYQSEEGDTGQYTHKRINIANKLPGWLVSWVDARLTVFDEKSWNAFPHLKTTYDCELFSKAKVSMISHHLPGVQTDDNALALDAAMLAQRKVVVIDIVNDPVASKAYVESEDPTRFHSKKAHIGPLRKDWMTNIPLVPDVPVAASEGDSHEHQGERAAAPRAKHAARLHGEAEEKAETVPGTQTPSADGSHAAGEHAKLRPQYPIMTCYKLFVIDFPYFGFMANRVENWITGAMRDVLLNYHRKAVCWMDEWYELSMADIRKMEDDVKRKLDAIRGQTAPPLPPPSSEAGKDEAVQDGHDAVVKSGGRLAAGAAAGAPGSPGSEGEETRDEDVHGADNGWSSPSDDEVDLDSAEKDLGMDLQATLPFAVTVDTLAPWSLDAPGIFALSSKKPGGLGGDQLSQLSRSASRHDAGPPGTAAAGNATTSLAAEPPKETILHSGFLYKLGDGLWNTTWNLRYVVLKGSRLQYFNDPREARAKCVVDLEGAEITWTGEMRGRSHSFHVHPACKRSMHFCGETAEASRQWMAWLQAASQNADHGPPERRRFSSFSCSHHFLPKSFSPSLAARAPYDPLGASSRGERSCPAVRMPPAAETRCSDADAEASPSSRQHADLLGAASQLSDVPRKESGDDQDTREGSARGAGEDERRAEGKDARGFQGEEGAMSRNRSFGTFASGGGLHPRAGLCGRAPGEGGVCDLLASPEVTPDLEYCVRRLRFLLSRRARPRFSPARNEDDIRVSVKDAFQWISLPPPRAVHIQVSPVSSSALPASAGEGHGDSSREGEGDSAARGEDDQRANEGTGARHVAACAEFSEGTSRLAKARAILCLVLPIVLPAFALYQCVILGLQGAAVLSAVSSNFLRFFSSLFALCVSLSPFSGLQSSSASGVSLFSSSLARLSAWCASTDPLAGEGSVSFACLFAAARLVSEALANNLLLFALRVSLWILFPFFLGMKLASRSRLFNPDSPHPHPPSSSFARQSRTSSALSVSPSAASRAPAERGRKAGVELAAPLSSEGRDLVVKANCVVNATAEELFLLLMDVELMGSWMLGHHSSPRVVSESIHSDFLSLSFSPSLLLSSSPAATAEAFLAACTPRGPAGHALCPGQPHRGGLAEKASVALSAARVGMSSPLAWFSSDLAAGVASAGAALAGPLLPLLLRDRVLPWRRWWGQTRDGSFVIIFHSEQLFAESCMRSGVWHSCGRSGERDRGPTERRSRRHRLTGAESGGRRETQRQMEEGGGQLGDGRGEEPVALKTVVGKLLFLGERCAQWVLSGGRREGLTAGKARNRQRPTLFHRLLLFLREAFPIAVHPFVHFFGPRRPTPTKAGEGEQRGLDTPWETTEDAVLASGFEAFVITPLSPSLEQLALNELVDPPRSPVPAGSSADRDSRSVSPGADAPLVGLQSPSAAAGSPPCLLTFVSAVDWGGEMPRWLRERISLLRADRILRGAKLEGEIRRARKRLFPGDQELVTEGLLETLDADGASQASDEDEVSPSPSSNSPSFSPPEQSVPAEAADAAPLGPVDARQRQEPKKEGKQESGETQNERDGGAAARRLPINMHLPFAREFKRSPQGGLVALNQAAVDDQKAVFLELVRNCGESVREGRGLVDVSLPVSMLQPESLLAFLGKCWSYAPLCLSRAADPQADALERFRWTVTFAVTSLHFGCCQQKPFNPLLGETYQGHWSDGTELFLEQTACEPPVTAFLARSSDGLFSFWGQFAFHAQLKGNYGVLCQEGETVVSFPRAKTEIRFSQPTAKVSGLLWGPRVFERGGQMAFRDERNRLACCLQFGVSGEPSTPPSQVPSDSFYGEIKDTETGATRSIVTGSWIDEVNFDGKTYWNAHSFPPASLEACPESAALPTDSRFRQDILCLREGLFEEAQEWKLALEAIQRRDRRVSVALPCVLAAFLPPLP
ncbi:hypothetical protein NCLIV_041820 [Neospora caninum Liverpool]|uniref:PH domain-containing protein n=1 Tax=Neospora caninum (strain Liverpool) TaxID=572307 RepID=F0VBX3_NEOCL|nr:hypothetical protein NCLIV_041820 [Neospora caninum Liverpool]CBZ51107.1 hypothetical protein NCLIV_041820 [Neospora caninum Liverpool]|eukprot:XP_003881140.1 hypothetical protein NCLIV_041820 [Neospora caninum Liverpool]